MTEGEGKKANCLNETTKCLILLVKNSAFLFRAGKMEVTG